MHKVVDQVKLLLRCHVHWVQLERLLKLVLGALVLASRAQNQAPDNPAFRVERLLLDAFADFLDSLDHVSLFEFSEGPVHVGVM